VFSVVNLMHMAFPQNSAARSATRRLKEIGGKFVFPVCMKESNKELPDQDKPVAAMNRPADGEISPTSRPTTREAQTIKGMEEPRREAAFAFRLTGLSRRGGSEDQKNGGDGGSAAEATKAGRNGRVAII
jgi:hypothetical protein